MKTIDKMIIKKYNEEQKNNIKIKVGIKNENKNAYSQNKPITRLFVPSLVSLCLSLIFLIASVTLFVIPNPQLPGNNLSNIEKHLKIATIDYIDRPVTTMIDNDLDLIIAIYYGIVGDALAEHSHYLVFEIISNEVITVETSIISEEKLIWSYQFILENAVNNFYSFETNYNYIKIDFIIGSTVKELNLDLTTYYNFLRY